MSKLMDKFNKFAISQMPGIIEYLYGVKKQNFSNLPKESGKKIEIRKYSSTT